MAYDQQSIDLKLNAQYASSSQLYAPVADPTWVEKTIVLAAKSISKKKLMIGIPTYGYEYDVTAYAGKEYLYDLLWSFNPGYATPIAAQYNVTPYRTPWGRDGLQLFSDGDELAARATSGRDERACDRARGDGIRRHVQFTSQFPLHGLARRAVSSRQNSARETPRRTRRLHLQTRRRTGPEGLERS